MRRASGRKHSQADQAASQITRTPPCDVGQTCTHLTYYDERHVRAQAPRRSNPVRDLAHIDGGCKQTTRTTGHHPGSQAHQKLQVCPTGHLANANRTSSDNRSSTKVGATSAAGSVHEYGAIDDMFQNRAAEGCQEMSGDEDEEVVTVVDLDDAADLDLHLPISHDHDDDGADDACKKGCGDDGIFMTLSSGDPAAVDPHLPLYQEAEVRKTSGGTQAGRGARTMSRDEQMEEKLSTSPHPRIPEQNVETASHFDGTDRSSAEQQIPKGACGRHLHSAHIPCGKEDPRSTVHGDITIDGAEHDNSGPEKSTANQGSNGCVRQVVRRVKRRLKKCVLRLRNVLCGMWSRMSDRRQWSMIWLFALTDSLGLRLKNSTLLLVWIIRIFNE